MIQGSSADEAHDAKGHRETERRTYLQALRRAIANAGYHGPINLTAGDAGAYEISIDPEPGIEPKQFRTLVGGPSGPASHRRILEEGLRMVDLAQIAKRRNDALRAAGCDPNSPPAWAFLGHPVIRGVIAALHDDPADHLPLDPSTHPGGMRLEARRHDLRLGHTGARVEHGGIRMEIDAGNQMARIRLMGAWPDTVVDTLVGRPLGDIVGLPGMGRGTPAGDAPVRDCWQDQGALGLTVSCRLVALADPPAGVEAGWLHEWEERHGH